MRSIHDLHVWGLDASEAALTAHLVLKGPEPVDTDELLRSASDELSRHFGIRHATLQLERQRPRHAPLRGDGKLRSSLRWQPTRLVRDGFPGADDRNLTRMQESPTPRSHACASRFEQQQETRECIGRTYG